MKAKIYNYKAWTDTTDPVVLSRRYSNILDIAGFTPRAYADHYCTPYGWSAAWILAESHLAIHTWPEQNLTYIELSSCVKKPFLTFRRLNRQCKVNKMVHGLKRFLE